MWYVIIALVVRLGSAQKNCLNLSSNIKSDLRWNPKSYDISQKGHYFLHDRGIYLELDPLPSITQDNEYRVSPGQSIEMVINHCGGTAPSDLTDVSFIARLRGPSLRALRIERSLDMSKYMVRGVAPMLPGKYYVDIKVRWYGGDGRSSEGKPPVFLGAEGRRKYHDKVWNVGFEWSKFRTGYQKVWQHIEEACVLPTRAQYVVLVEPLRGLASSKSTRAPCNRQDLLTYSSLIKNTEMVDEGYWSAETPHGSNARILSRIMDGANLYKYTYRLNNCSFNLPSDMDINRDLGKVQKIMVFGDSLSYEMYAGLKTFLKPHKLAYDKQSFVDACQSGSSVFKSLKSDGYVGKTIIIENLRVAWSLFDKDKSVYQAKLDKYTRMYQQSLLKCIPWDGVRDKIAGIFLGGYPIHHLRDDPPKDPKEKFITGPRMRQYNQMTRKHFVQHFGDQGASKSHPWYFLDATAVLDPYWEASWDGFHYKQISQGIGGASTMLSLQLFNLITSLV